MRIDLPADTPEEIRDLVRHHTGEDPVVTALGGMSGARVLLVRGRLGSVVVKVIARRRERDAYRLLGSELRRAGIGTPVVHGDAEADGMGWLVLETIPGELPRDRRLADPALLDTLRRLHGLGAEAIDVLRDPFVPAWHESTTRRAMALMPTASALVARLDDLRREAAPLFEPVTAISADPNPTNWRLRANGDLVLLDWERVGRGHPALDLAISIPGLGLGADFEQVIAGYERLGGAPLDAAPLTPRMLQLAKLWTAIELLAESTVPSAINTREPVAPTDPASERRRDVAVALGMALPDWIQGWEAVSTRG